MTALSIVFSILVAASVLLGFVGLLRLTAVEDPVDVRLAQYGGVAAAADETSVAGGHGKRFHGLNRLLNRMNLGGSFADRLTRADVPLTVAEFLLMSSSSWLGWPSWGGGGGERCSVWCLASPACPSH